MKKLYTTLNNAGNGLKIVIEWVLFLLFVVLIASGTVQVCSREFFHKSFIWSEELCRYSGIWIIMLGTSVLFGTDEHIKLDYFLLKFSKPIQEVITVITYVLMMVTMGWFFYYSYVMIAKTGSTRSSALHVPMGVVYICLLLCSSLSIFYMLISLLKYLTNIEADEDKKEEEK